MNNPEPLIDVARGDVGLSRYLKDTLRLLASNTRDSDLQQQIRDISAGRAGLHTLLQSETFAALLDKALPTAGEEAAARSEEELHRLAVEGEAVLQRYRDRPTNDVADVESVPRSIDPSVGAGAADPNRPSSANIPTLPPNRVVPGTRKPNRDLVVGPNDIDDNDDFFEERRGGWLR